MIRRNVRRNYESHDGGSKSNAHSTMLFLSRSSTTTLGVLAFGNWRRCSVHGWLPYSIPKVPRLLFSSSSSGRSKLESTPDTIASAEEPTETNAKRHGFWKIMDWNTFDTRYRNYATDFPISSAPLLPVHYPHPSPVQLVHVRNRPVYVKRDDLLRLSHSNNISGNKARKLLSLSLLPPEQFPSVIVSYGGPQSNAMVALAAIVQQKDREAASSHPSSSSSSPQPQKRFLYYTKKLPRYLRDQPCGNLVRATTLGMELQQVSPQEYKHLFGTEVDGKLVQYPPDALHLPSSVQHHGDHDILWIPQGAACGVAYHGVYQLAVEICTFWRQEQKRTKRHLPLTVIIPSGTGTVALFLHQALQQLQQPQNHENDDLEISSLPSSQFDPFDIQVCAIPCVGDTAYLLRQMIGLDIATGGSGSEQNLPQVWEVDSPQRFGEPTQEILQTFQEMKHYGLFLDLLYGAPTWNLLLRKGQFPQQLFPQRQIMYVHCGGLDGISTQLTRYKHKGLIDARDIQV